MSSIYYLYAANMVVGITPLVHITLTCQFSRFFVYFVVLSSFIGLNLAGSITQNILDTGEGLTLQISLLATTLFLASLYPFLLLCYKNKTINVQIQQRNINLLALSKRLRLFAKFVAILTVIVCLFHFVLVSPPLWIKSNLLGHWGALEAARTAVLFGENKFHWFSLAFNEATLFWTILCCVGYMAARRGALQEAKRWFRLILILIPLAILLSISFLTKMNAFMILFSIFLTTAILSGHFFSKGLVAAVGCVLMLIPLYMTYLGFSLDKMKFILQLITHRIFECYAWSAAVGLYLFPDKFGFLEGTSYINYFNLFPYEQTHTAPLIYPLMYQGTGDAPMPALYEMYANFGWTGFVLGLVLIAFMILFFTRLSWSKNPFYFVSSIYFTIKFTLVWMSAFWFGILDLSILVFICILWSFWPKPHCTVQQCGFDGIDLMQRKENRNLH